MTGTGLMDANTDTLARVVQMAAVVVQEIEGHRSKLEGEVNSVIPAQWNMEQSQALLVAHRKWDMAIRNLCQKLEKLGNDTRFAMNDYIDVDQQGSACFRGVGEIGGGGAGLGGGFAGAGIGGGVSADLGELGGLGGGLGELGDLGGDSGDSDSDSGSGSGSGESGGGGASGGGGDADCEDGGEGGGIEHGSSGSSFAFAGVLRAL
ncbi:hypothetical protein ACFS2C_10410 [Prauserella oleivorans]|uniref:WXG100 family type VII secretion target n=1 Tax=Prauserella oleivorans TaxID=1478153 RepID=A0ABW5W8P3_9PSEU